MSISRPETNVAGLGEGILSGVARGPRVDRTRVELERLRTDHAAWLRVRRKAQEAERYKSQLDAIESLMDHGIGQLSTGIEAIDESQSPGAVYEACRTFDLRVLWLRRVWQFFREKLDQRDGALADTLHAADEVVWSCYRQVFERARVMVPGIQAVAPPLPFIEPRYSPSTFPADLVPAGLQSEVDRPFLRQHLNRLPVPVVRLQPSCVSGPWWLVYAAHEVGHSVQYDLLDRQEMVGLYRELVERAVSDAGGDAAEATRWGHWSREIFADLFSLLMMGPWAIWALVEVELQSDDAMTERRELYPSGAVRLELMAAAATALGLDTDHALRGVRPREIAACSASARHDIGFVDAVVTASLRRLPSLDVTLASLCDFSPADFLPTVGANRPETQRIRAALAAGEEVAVARSLSGPRLAAAASLAAWSDVMATASAATRNRLADQARQLVTESGPPGSRASEADRVASYATDAASAASDLIGSLLAAGPDELED